MEKVDETEVRLERQILSLTGDTSQTNSVSNIWLF